MVDGVEKLCVMCVQLLLLKLKFVFVMFGVGGLMQQGMFDIVFDMQKDGFEVVLYLLCIGLLCDSLCVIFDQYCLYGIWYIVVLCGDLLLGMGEVGELCYVFEFVSFICVEYGDWFYIEVVGYLEYYL